jgi:hypothetical protein
MVQQQTRFKRTETFEQRLSREALQFNEGANNSPSRRYDRELPPNRVERAETASNINKWLSSKICAKAC